MTKAGAGGLLSIVETELRSSETINSSIGLPKTCPSARSTTFKNPNQKKKQKGNSQTTIIFKTHQPHKRKKKTKITHPDSPQPHPDSPCPQTDSKSSSKYFPDSS